MIACTCPLGAALSDVSISTCPETVGQIQKVIFQRKYASAGTLNKFVKASADPATKASWTALLSAAGSTKVVITPYIEAPTVEPGAAKEFGSGNEVLGGMPIIVGSDPTTFTAAMRSAAQKTISELKTFMCEDIGVFLCDEHGDMWMIADNVTTPANYYPIPIKTLFVGDKKLGGFDEPDSNVISWRFAPNWSDMLVKVNPTDFNPLTDLADVTS